MQKEEEPFPRLDALQQKSSNSIGLKLSRRLALCKRGTLGMTIGNSPDNDNAMNRNSLDNLT